MAQNDIHDDKPRSRAKTWDIGATRRRAGFMQPTGLADTSGWLGRLLSQWALAEVAPGRLLPWLPVAFGFGIVGYFTADREPALWAAASAALAVALVLTPTAFGLLAGVLVVQTVFGSVHAITLGFAATLIEDGHMDHTVRHAIEHGGLHNLGEITRAVASLGGLAYTARLAQCEADQALAALAPLPESAFKEGLSELAKFAVARKN